MEFKTIITNVEALKMGKRKCGYCGERKDKADMFISPLMAFCNRDHAAQYAFDNKNKVADKKHKEKKRKLKENDKPFRERQAQAAFNKFIRIRDAADPCISCGRHHSGQYHAGHYKSRGAHPELRFEELNCHKQCSPCNNHLSGNIVNYRPRLIDKIGLDNVEWLEGPHDIVKYTCEDLKQIELKYKTKVKELTESDKCLYVK